MPQLLPPGVTVEMLQNIAKFFAEQPQERPRPSGTLSKNQIQGLNPKYKYVFQEYPKALTPPDVKINNQLEERSFRAQHKMALPWDAKDYIDAYYAVQNYPKLLVPPQVIVDTPEEEDAKLASWRVANPDRVVYPRWMFHYALPAVMVNDRRQEEALGPDWFSTPAEAIQMAGDKAKVTEKQLSEHDRLVEEALAAGLKVDKRWSIERLKNALADIKAKEPEPVKG